MKMNEIDPDIDESWKTELKEEFEKPYFGRLRAYLVNEKKKTHDLSSWKVYF
jgi:uracil DNA glycosylase